MSQPISTNNHTKDMPSGRFPHVQATHVQSTANITAQLESPLVAISPECSIALSRQDTSTFHLFVKLRPSDLALQTKLAEIKDVSGLYLTSIEVAYQLRHSRKLSSSTPEPKTNEYAAFDQLGLTVEAAGNDRRRTMHTSINRMMRIIDGPLEKLPASNIILHLLSDDGKVLLSGESGSTQLLANITKEFQTRVNRQRHCNPKRATPDEPLQRSIERTQKVLSLFAEGLGTVEIGRRVDVHQQVAEDMLNGHPKPISNTIRNHKRYSIRFQSEATLPVLDQPVVTNSTLTIIGFLLCNRNRGLADNNIELRGAADVLEFLKEHCRNIPDVLAIKDSERPGRVHSIYPCVEVKSDWLSNVYNKYTANGSTLPWEALTDKHSRRCLLRGILLDMGGSAGHKLRLQRNGDKASLAVEIASLLDSVGINCSIRINGKSILEISNPDSLYRLIHSDPLAGDPHPLVQSKRLTEEVNALCSGTALKQYKPKYLQTVLSRHQDALLVCKRKYGLPNPELSAFLHQTHRLPVEAVRKLQATLPVDALRECGAFFTHTKLEAAHFLQLGYPEADTLKERIAGLLGGNSIPVQSSSILQADSRLVDAAHARGCLQVEDAMEALKELHRTTEDLYIATLQATASFDESDSHQLALASARIFKSIREWNGSLELTPILSALIHARQFCPSVQSLTRADSAAALTALSTGPSTVESLAQTCEVSLEKAEEILFSLTSLSYGNSGGEGENLWSNLNQVAETTARFLTASSSNLQIAVDQRQDIVCLYFAGGATSEMIAHLLEVPQGQVEGILKIHIALKQKELE